MSLAVDEIRSQFPALARTINGHPAIYFDGPGGTQVPQRVIDRMNDYLVNHNANIHGSFATTRETDQMLHDARVTFADFFGCDWDEVAFGHNATTINFKLSQALLRDLQPGDEIIITDIDHETNRGPWLLLKERGLVVNSIRLDPDTLTLDQEDYRAQLSPKTKVVALNYASNAVGTITDVRDMIRQAHAVGAVTVVDAVHYALHGAIDVRTLDTDYLFCSAYKFFGPHVGILYARKSALDKLRTLRVAPQDPEPPYKFETGTLNHEGIAGAAEAVEFIAEIGRTWGDDRDAALVPYTGRRKAVVAGMRAIDAYEQPLARYFREQLRLIDGLRLYGPHEGVPCTSTIAFTLEGISPADIAHQLSEKGIFVWDGHFFATRLIECLGLTGSGGLLRIGLAPYNTRTEIDRTLAEINALAPSRPH
ncbi:MAG: cysteine desulfurase-like protein [Fidelibacterota bacterium]|nr:MAG: cysteine desulfurase-like protein [Candidatus Neomarinimicrobiota bacterium]